MARLLCESNINFTSSSWKVIDNTSFNNSEATAALTTTSYVSGSNSTPGAITVDGIMLKYRYVVTNTGTLSAEIYNSTGAASVAGTEVTINVSDLNMVNQAGSNSTGGFIYLKFGSPVTLLAATNYNVRVKTSTASTVYVNASSGTNWSIGLVTSTNAAPAASDNLYFCGPFTTTSTPVFVTCTYDNTASTVWGSFELGGFAKNILQNSASTAYKLSIATGGYYKCTLNSESEFGTSSSRVPATSSIFFELQSGGAGANGLEIRSPAKFRMYGETKTRKAKLAANSSAGATSLTTDVSTGWKNGDNIVFANTIRSGTVTALAEKKALTADASGTALTITAMTNAKLGSGVLICDIGNVTSNAQIYGSSTTNTMYILTGVASNVGGIPVLDLDNVEMRYIGSNTADKYGISCYGTTGSTHNISNCGMHDCHANSRGVSMAAAIDNFTISGNVFHSGSYGVIISTNNSTLSGTRIITSNLLLAHTSNAILLGNSSAITSDVTCTFNTASSSANAFNININNSDSLFTDNIGYGNSVSCLTGTVTRSTIKRIDGYINNYYGSVAVFYDSFFDTGTWFGNQYCNIGCGGCLNAVFMNITSNSYSPATTSSFIIATGSAAIDVFFDNCTTGNLVQHSRVMEPVTIVSYKINFRSCTINESLLALLGSSIAIPSYSKVCFQNLNGGANNHRYYSTVGTATSDTTIYDTAPISMRLTPISASAKFRGSTFRTSVKSGTTTTISVKVRKSVSGDGTAYNGNQPRLIMKSNISAGSSFAYDIVAATATDAANGAWQTLTYTTPSVSQDTVLEFYVDCDGTTGWINWDTIR